MLSIIITCDSNRNALEALRLNRDQWSRIPCEIVVVTFGTKRQVNADLSALGANVIAVKERPFNKSLGINLGVSVSRAKSLFLLDADVVIGEESIKNSLRILEAGHFSTIRKVKERDQRPLLPRAGQDRIKLTFAAKSFDVVSRRTFSDGSRSGPGLIFLRREWFVSVGGMNSQLMGWGWEDIDLICRLHMKLNLQRKETGTALHLSHHAADLKTAHDRQESEATNLRLCLDKYRRGDLDGTLEKDIFSAMNDDFLTVTYTGG